MCVDADDYTKASTSNNASEVKKSCYDIYDEFEFEQMNQDSDEEQRRCTMDDSMITQSFSTKPRVAHLELLLQKANSISGIRKMNMQFKLERRQIAPFKQEHNQLGYLNDSVLAEDYWNLCSTFIEMMELKRQRNVKLLSQATNFDLLYENIKSEVDFDVHCAIGLGKRMPVPKMDQKRAQTLKQ